MQTLESLNRKIRTAQDLLAVVKTMKNLAAVNIRQYERAAQSMDAFRSVVDKGWQVFLRASSALPWRFEGGKAVCLVVGSDQGMCGPFNEAVVRQTLQKMRVLEGQGIGFRCWSMGEKMADSLADAGLKSEVRFSLPGSLAMVVPAVQEVVQRLDEWRAGHRLERFYIGHNVLEGGGGYAPSFYRLLPLEREWAQGYRERPWPNRCLPMLGQSRESTFAGLFHEYLFSALYRVCAQSLAGENAARLAAMQAAEKNILEMEEDLLMLFREQRQAQITNELLDIISGFEALREAPAVV